MEPADFRKLHDSPPRRWFDGTWLGRVLVEREMRSGSVVVVQVASQDPPQVTLAENNDVVQAFPTDRADDPLHVRILPGRARRNENLLDPQSMNGSVEVIAVYAIPIANQKTRGSVPGDGFEQLTPRPFRTGMLSHVEVQDPTTIMKEHEKDKQDSKADRGHGEDVDGDEVLEVVVEEGPPRRTRRLAGADHVLADGRLG